jgi:hypothetical protein
MEVLIAECAWRRIFQARYGLILLGLLQIASSPPRLSRPNDFPLYFYPLLRCFSRRTVTQTMAPIGIIRRELGDDDDNPDAFTTGAKVGTAIAASPSAFSDLCVCLKTD